MVCLILDLRTVPYTEEGISERIGRKRWGVLGYAWRFNELVEELVQDDRILLVCVADGELQDLNLRIR